jgi:hypothetical protein
VPRSRSRPSSPRHRRAGRSACGCPEPHPDMLRKVARRRHADEAHCQQDNRHRRGIDRGELGRTEICNGRAPERHGHPSASPMSTSSWTGFTQSPRRTSRGDDHAEHRPRAPSVGAARWVDRVGQMIYRSTDGAASGRGEVSTAGPAGRTAKRAGSNPSGSCVASPPHTTSASSRPASGARRIPLRP